MKTNKQGLTYIASCLDMTLTQLLLYYTSNDDFKITVDEFLEDINSRRITNGLEKLDINSYLSDLVESN